MSITPLLYQNLFTYIIWRYISICQRVRVMVILEDYFISNSFSISSIVGRLPRKSFGNACPNS